MRKYDFDLLAGVSGEEVMLHLLRCPHCRDMVLAQYGVQQAASVPPPPAPGKKKPAARKEAEWLFDALLRLSPKKRTAALKNPQYHRADLLELILERSEEAQAENVNRADELAWLAISLATNIDADDVRLRKHLVRGFCLAGNARRMAGDLSAAESAFDNASFFLSGDPLERGLYCRALALLRWDQGRLDEAAALLRHAAGAYGEKEDSVEEGACLALLGLLHTEAEDFFPAIGPLMRGQLALAPVQRHDWLLARSTLSLALCLAEEGRAEQVRELMSTALAVGAIVEGEEERARIDWLHGRIEARIGEAGRAERQLDAARRRFLEERRLAEATLATLDLAVVYEENERRSEVESLIADLEARSEGLGGRDVALEVLRGFASEHLRATDPRERARMYSRELRQTFRLRNLRSGALPWI